MAKAKRIRWDCPNGLHAGVLGSTRPPADATVRFCLLCSEESGRLVPRVAPALERKRTVRRERQSSKAQREREAAAAAREAARHVTVTTRGGELVQLDAVALLEEAWRTEELRAACVEAATTFPRVVGRARRPPVPELVVRVGRPDTGRAGSHGHADEPRARSDRSLAVRARDGLSGHAKGHGYEIVLTVAPTCGEEWLRAIVVHEAAHCAAPLGERHGRRWRTAYLRAVRELYGSAPANEGAAWQLDEAVAQMIYEGSAG